ncbi:hypothetical protein N5P37_006310 [Trichoderma harzianum]|nr:hypothetical protein N5P37_006310 [Trichoderma harzianum]PKK52750.1 hypothetical protein CI102_2484 [Trichoderma harzianum]
MGPRPKHYFLAPTGNPLNGQIKLGNIIALPRLADDPINENHVPLGSVPMEITEHNEYDYTFNLKAKSGGRIGIWASFLQTIGLKAEATVEDSRQHSEQWAFEKLQTISFAPKLAYITKCLEDDGVRNFLWTNKPYFGTSNLYMITGIKVAYGASSVVQYAKKKGIALRLGSGFTGNHIGPEFSRNDEIGVSQSQGGADPFVFAFRLRRIKLSLSGEVGHEQYSKGAMLGIKGDEDNESNAQIPMVVEDIESDEDVHGSELQLESKDALDESSSGDEFCKCVISED